MKIGSIIICFSVALLLITPIFYHLNKRYDIKRQQTELAIDVGKLLFINIVVSNKDKSRKQIDSIYEIRKDSILDKIYK